MSGQGLDPDAAAALEMKEDDCILTVAGKTVAITRAPLSVPPFWYKLQLIISKKPGGSDCGGFGRVLGSELDGDNDPTSLKTNPPALHPEMDRELAMSCGAVSLRAVG